ncbi:MAG: hypothetical protein AAFY85_09205, partial [Pseudomonadota bacterium]
MRNTSTPAFASSWTVSGDRLPGPIVARIFPWRFRGADMLALQLSRRVQPSTLACRSQVARASRSFRDRITHISRRPDLGAGAARANSPFQDRSRVSDPMTVMSDSDILQGLEPTVDIAVREVFGLDTDMVVKGFKERTE